MRFDSYHPVINLIYFAAAIVCTIWFHHPVFLGISYVCAFVYSVKLNGKRAVIFNLCLIPLIFLLPHLLSDRVFAVFLAEPVSDITAGIVTGIMFFSRLPGILRRGPGGMTEESGE